MTEAKAWAIAILFAILLALGYFAYWASTLGCVCYNAKLHSHEHLPIDAAITEMMGIRQDNGTFTLITNTCPHGVSFTAMVFDEYYTVEER